MKDSQKEQHVKPCFAIFWKENSNTRRLEWMKKKNTNLIETSQEIIFNMMNGWIHWDMAMNSYQIIRHLNIWYCPMIRKWIKNFLLLSQQNINRIFLYITKPFHALIEMITSYWSLLWLSIESQQPQFFMNWSLRVSQW